MYILTMLNLEVAMIILLKYKRVEPMAGSEIAH